MRTKLIRIFMMIVSDQNNAIRNFFKSLVIIVISPFLAVTLIIGAIFCDGISFNYQLIEALFEGSPLTDVVEVGSEYLKEIQYGLSLIDDRIESKNEEFENGASLNVYQVKGYFIGFMMSSQHQVFNEEMATSWVDSFTEGEEKISPTSVNSVIYKNMESNLGIELKKDTKKSMETCYASLIGNDGGTVTTLSKEEIEKIINKLPEGTSELRKKVIIQAADSVGKIPYYWGGTASCSGYDGNEFGKIITPDKKGRNRKGLDCSHFVDWVYWTVMKNNLGNTNTAGQIKMCKKISEKELLAGDLAFLKDKAGKTTHVGIYAGVNEKGEKVWIHENSNDNNVAMNTVSYWSGYYRLKIMEER